MAELVCRADDPGLCSCGYPIADHIRGKACAVSPVRITRGLYDLPIFAWAWAEGQ